MLLEEKRRGNFFPSLDGLVIFISLIILIEIEIHWYMLILLLHIAVFREAVSHLTKKTLASRNDPKLLPLCRYISPERNVYNRFYLYKKIVGWKGCRNV